MNGKMVTRGKGYEGYTLHELRYPNKNKIPTSRCRPASDLAA